ncbi:hypothetical protein BD749_0219 [Pontibacter ramchanderi]|uniref:Uncharacterized protein n=1 Tax=Pontibacter ramchanderi TaxID=1179743 RepID=A0A2N3V0X1_9BACT|nr:hypothetical protein BD749_0219 [Pontibacter ramchanderi]
MVGIAVASDSSTFLKEACQVYLAGLLLFADIQVKRPSVIQG